jgi:CRP-like cAMP-binding protein
MMARTPAGENRLLSKLNSGDMAALRPHLKSFTMNRSTILHPGGSAIGHVYFPLSGMVSLLAVTKSGGQIETGMIGREGVVGASIANYGRYPFGQATVQIAGAAMRIRSEPFLKIYAASERFRRAVNASQSLIFLQAHQSAACHALHTVEQRLCRWLLQSQDVIESHVIPLTQEFLSHMLGVQRNAVSLSGSILQERGWIEYSRGKIRIISRAQLRRNACECYEVVRESAQRARNEA